MAHAQLPGQAHSQGYRDPRVSFLLMPGDVLVQCPYDKVHWVLEPKFTGHLSKCHRNFMNAVQSGKAVMTPDKDFVVCPFHFYHRVPRAELEEHKASCPNNPETDKIKEQIAQAQAKKEKGDDHFSLYGGTNEAKPEYGGILPGGFGDAGAGPYGEVKNSAAGFWGKEDLNRQAEDYDDDDVGFFSKKEHKKRIRYVNGVKVEIAASEPINQRLLTMAQMNDPDYNWEIPQEKNPSATVKEEAGEGKERRFTTYNPMANIDKKKGSMITNPQGLTKSERKAYRDDVTKNISLKLTSEYFLRCEKKGISGGLSTSPSSQLGYVKEEVEEEESAEEEEERTVTPMPRRPGWRYNPKRTGTPGYELSLDMETESLPNADDVK